MLVTLIQILFTLLFILSPFLVSTHLMSQKEEKMNNKCHVSNFKSISKEKGETVAYLAIVLFLFPTSVLILSDGSITPPWLTAFVIDWFLLLILTWVYTPAMNEEEMDKYRNKSHMDLIVDECSFGHFYSMDDSLFVEYQIAQKSDLDFVTFEKNNSPRTFGPYRLLYSSDKVFLCKRDEHNTVVYWTHFNDEPASIIP